MVHFLLWSRLGYGAFAVYLTFFPVYLSGLGAGTNVLGVARRGSIDHINFTFWDNMHRPLLLEEGTVANALSTFHKGDSAFKPTRQSDLPPESK